MQQNVTKKDTIESMNGRNFILQGTVSERKIN